MTMDQSPMDAGTGAGMSFPPLDTGGVAAGSAGGTYAGGDANVMPLVNGPCPPLTTFTVATKIEIPVAWMAFVGTNKGGGDPNPQMDTVYTWTLGTGTIANGKVTSTSKVCASTTPPQVLNGVGAMAEMVPMGETGMVWALLPNSTWTKPDMPTYANTGTWPSSDVGTMVTVDPALNTLGLKASSSFATTMMWPGNQGYMIDPVKDAEDSDDDGKPGVTLSFDKAKGFYPALSSGTMGEAVDQVYIVSRTEYSLKGTIQPGCVDVEGTATATVQQSAVIGCHKASGSDCTTGAGSEAAYVDSSNPIYTFPKAGTYHQKQLTSGATCADVLTALP
jgi:hypothetical protein